MRQAALRTLPKLPARRGPPVPKPAILVVEDDALIALAASAMLGRAGCEAIGTAASAELADLALARRRPDLVLLDVTLAGPEDGVALARRLALAGIPFIFASAEADPGTLQRMLALRPAGLLRKPYSEAELHAVVRAALMLRRRAEAPARA